MLHRGTMEAGHKKAATQGKTSLAGVQRMGAESRLENGKCHHRGGRDGTAEEAGDKAVKRVKAAGQAQTKSHVVLKKHIGELRRVLDGKKSSLRKTHKNQAEANDKSLVTEGKH